LLFRGLLLLKSPANEKLDVQSYIIVGSVEFMEPKTYEKFCQGIKKQFGIYWNDVGVLGCKLSWLSHDTECMLR
jgi:hypothetical protein